MIVLLGKSASGKTCIGFELEKLGYKKIVTFTTRPIRPNETNGVDYYFVSQEEFNTMLFEFIDVKTYILADGTKVYYGLMLPQDANDPKLDNYYLIIDPIGFMNIKDRYLTDTDISFLIDVRDSIRINRSLHGDRADNEAEVRRRCKADNEDFKIIEGKYNYLIKNEYENEADKVALHISNIYKSKEDLR